MGLNYSRGVYKANSHIWVLLVLLKAKRVFFSVRNKVLIEFEFCCELNTGLYVELYFVVF